jgi:hypothetical protein
MHVNRCSASGAIVAGPKTRREASIVCPVCRTSAQVTAEEQVNGREIWRLDEHVVSSAAEISEAGSGLYR